MIDKNHIWHPYTEIPSTIDTYKISSAKGIYITLNDKKIIDGMSSWWSNIFGYNHPTLNQAIKSQVDDFSHIMFGGITHQPAIDLTKKLISILPPTLDKIFFADSGSVAIEVAMKMALQYWFKQGKNKTKFITPFGGYHGDTIGAMSVCDPINGMHNMFAKNLMQNIFTLKPNLLNTAEALQDLRHKLEKNSDIAAMILEPIVQGAGGMNIYSPLYLTGVRNLCDEFNILLIIDEIATGFARTGKLFACDYAGITPDIICIGKAMTGGYLSLGATITNNNIANKIGVLMHGPTFMANPLACSVANANIDLLLNSNWEKNIKRIEKVLTNGLLPLEDKGNIKEVRVLGAIGVVEFKDNLDINMVQKTLVKNGVWLRPFGRLLYTMPPYITTNKELIVIINAIKKVVNQL